MVSEIDEAFNAFGLPTLSIYPYNSIFFLNRQFATSLFLSIHRAEILILIVAGSSITSNH